MKQGRGQAACMYITYPFSAPPRPPLLLMKSALGRQRQHPVSSRTTPHVLIVILLCLGRVLFSINYLGLRLRVLSRNWSTNNGQLLIRARGTLTAMFTFDARVEQLWPNIDFDLCDFDPLSVSSANSFSAEDATPALTAFLHRRHGHRREPRGEAAAPLPPHDQHSGGGGVYRRTHGMSLQPGGGQKEASAVEELLGVLKVTDIKKLSLCSRRTDQGGRV